MLLHWGLWMHGDGEVTPLGSLLDLGTMGVVPTSTCLKFRSNLPLAIGICHGTSGQPRYLPNVYNFLSITSYSSIR